MKQILIILSLVVLCSCSANYHLKRSKHHLDKAISKGYQPFEDTTRTLTSIKPVSINISPNKRPLVVQTIDSILEQNNCLNDVIRSQIIKVIDSVPKYVLLDTTLIAENGAKLHLSIKDGKLNANWENLQTERTVYIEQKQTIVKKITNFLELLGWILILFLVGFGIVKIIKFLKDIISPL